MTDIELVIKIPKATYMITLERGELAICNDDDIYGWIKNGNPLPKRHGRLIDADAYRKEMLDSREFDFFKRLDMQPTIIEADKVESENK